MSEKEKVNIPGLFRVNVLRIDGQDGRGIEPEKGGFGGFERNGGGEAQRQGGSADSVAYEPSESNAMQRESGELGMEGPRPERKSNSGAADEAAPANQEDEDKVPGEQIADGDSLFGDDGSQDPEKTHEIEEATDSTPSTRSTSWQSDPGGDPFQDIPVAERMSTSEEVRILDVDGGGGAGDKSIVLVTESGGEKVGRPTDDEDNDQSPALAHPTTGGKVEPHIPPSDVLHDDEPVLACPSTGRDVEPSFPPADVHNEGDHSTSCKKALPEMHTPHPDSEEVVLGQPPPRDLMIPVPETAAYGEASALPLAVPPVIPHDGGNGIRSGEGAERLATGAKTTPPVVPDTSESGSGRGDSSIERPHPQRGGKNILLVPNTRPETRGKRTPPGSSDNEEDEGDEDEVPSLPAKYPRKRPVPNQQTPKDDGGSTPINLYMSNRKRPLVPDPDEEEEQPQPAPQPAPPPSPAPLSSPLSNPSPKTRPVQKPKSNPVTTSSPSSDNEDESLGPPRKKARTHKPGKIQCAFMRPPRGRKASERCKRMFHPEMGQLFCHEPSHKAAGGA